MTKFITVFFFMTIIILMTGCSLPTNPALSNKAYPEVLYFPVQKTPGQPVPQQLILGTTLKIDNGYLKAGTSNSGESVLIWPPGYSNKIENGVVKIYDGTGNFKCKVGDIFDIGGGPAATREIVKNYTGSFPPKNCSGPFWLVSDITLPYVFENVKQAGVANAPPVDVNLSTDFPTEPDSVMVYTVENVDLDYINSLAKRLGFVNKSSIPDNGNGPHTFLEGVDYKPMTAAPPNTEVLEIYQDGRIWMRGSIKIGNSPKSLPSFDEAVKIARDWLVTNDLYPANVTSIQKGGSLTVQDSVTGETTTYWVTVKFNTRLGDIDLYSPSAMVCVGENGKIVQAFVTMTQLREYQSVKLKTPQAALNILKGYLSSPLAEPAEARECLVTLRNFARLTVTRISLEYVQNADYLQPVYVFYGSAYNQKSYNPDAFTGKVDAVVR